MLGKQIRSFNHLLNLCKKSKMGLRIIGITQHGFSVDEYYVFPIEDKKDGKMLLLSKTFRARGISPGGQYTKVSNEYRDKVIHLEKEGFSGVSMYSRGDMHHLPTLRFVVEDDAEEKYENFIASNKKIVDTVSSKYIDSKGLLSLFLFLVTEGNATFYAWAAKAVAQFKMSMYTLLHIMDFNSKHSTLIKRLTKQNIIALGNSKDVLEALWESFHLRAEVIANKTVSLFNPTQKKILKEKLSDSHTIQLLNNFSKLSMRKKINFVRKVSTIEDVGEILKMMAFVCTNSHFGWNQQSFHEFIKNVEGLKYKIVYEKPNLTVVQVFDFETIKRLGKMTNWCISKNKSYWEQYVGKEHNPQQYMVEEYDPTTVQPYSDEDNERLIKLFDPDDMFSTSKNDEKSVFFKNIMLIDNELSSLSHNTKNKQYMVFDFSKNEDDILSIVGITVNSKKGIVNAHNFTNGSMLNRRHGILDPLMDEAPAPLPVEYFGFSTFCWIDSILEQERKVNNNDALKEDPNSIKTFIKIHQIDPDLFNDYRHSKYEWNKKGLFDFLNKLMDEEDYDVVYESDDKVLLCTQNPRIAALMENVTMFYPFYRGLGLGQRITKYIDSNPKSFWYFDFTKPKNDVNKILLYFIYEQGGGNYTVEKATNPFNVLGNSVNGNEGISFNEMLFDLGLPFDIIRRPDGFNSKLKYFIRTERYDKVYELLVSEPEKELSGQTQHMLVESLIYSFMDLHTKELYDKLMSLDRPLASLLSKKGVKQFVSSVAPRITHFLWDLNADLYKFLNNETEIVHYVEEVKDKLEKYHQERINNRRNGLGRGNSEVHLMSCAIAGNIMLYALLNFIERAYKEGNENIISVFLNESVETIPHLMSVGSTSTLPSKNFINEIIKRYIDRWNCVDNNVLRSLFSISIINSDIIPVLENKIDLYFSTTTPKLKNAFGPITNLLNIYINGNRMPKELFLSELSMIYKTINKYNYLTEDEKEIVKKTIKEKLCNAEKMV